MPTVLRIGPYRFFFVSLDFNEPPHIHVKREKMVAKFWLDPVALQLTGGFRRRELRPDLDEDLSVSGILAGRRSGESQKSLKRWLEERGARNL